MDEVLTFTIECDFCENSFAVEAPIEEQIAQISDWIRNHSCTPLPTRDDVLGWAKGDD